MPTPIEEIFAKIGNRQELSTGEQHQLQNYIRRSQEIDVLLGKWQGNGVETPKITAQETSFILSPSRSIVFTETTKTSIPNNSYTQIDFAGIRGLMGDDERSKEFACVKYVSGYNDRFTKQDWVRPRYPILFFGDFGFDTNANGSREIYIEFFDASDASLGGYTFSAGAAPSDWTNFSFNFLDWFNDGDYCKFWVWQDSGSPLAIMSANFGFLLG